MNQDTGKEPRPGVSKLKLAVGAASLFLFIVGLKRSFSMDDSGDGVLPDDEGPDPGESPERAQRPGGARRK